ncbi:hypothetical protein FXO38_15166 [Capsicum annuum]|nr:hypothetical protein FXO38_15166 [Capsicum annuum]
MSSIVSAASGWNYSIDNRSNHHPKMIYMTKAIMSINSSSTFPALLKPQHFNQGHFVSTPNINGEFTKQPHSPERTTSLHHSLTTTKLGTNVMGGACFERENHLPLCHRRGSADSPSHSGPDMDGTDNEGGRGLDSGGARLPSLVSNTATSPDNGNPQHDKFRRIQLANRTHVQEPTLLPNSSLPLGDENLELHPLEPIRRTPHNTKSPTNNGGHRPRRRNYLTLEALKHSNLEMKQLLMELGDPKIEYFFLDKPLWREF